MQPKFLCFLLGLSALFIGAGPYHEAFAQEDTVIEETVREMTDFPVVKLRSLDKITARTQTFEAAVGAVVRFGSLYIKTQACRKAPPIEEPESAAFLQIWEGLKPEEKKDGQESEWVFSGWMFASSPGLSTMDHPVYDVWVLDCIEEKGAERTQGEEANELLEGEGELEDEVAPQTPDIDQTIEVEQ